MAEAEQVFFNAPLLVLEDSKHSKKEPRFHTLGKSDEKRQLHTTFTLRQAGERIRITSTRDMHKKERVIYKNNLKRYLSSLMEKRNNFFGSRTTLQITSTGIKRAR